MTKLNAMNQDQVIDWINTLTFSDEDKNDIINGIKQYAAKYGDPVTGSDLIEAEEEIDIQELTAKAIGKKLAGKLLVEVGKKNDKDKSKDYNVNIKKMSPSNNNNEEFTLTLTADQGKPVLIEKVTKSWTVAKVKAKYLASQGNHVAAAKYNDLRNAKWGSNNEGKIDLTKSGKVMKNENTMEYYEITCQTQAIMPIIVVFKCKGGAEAKHNDADQYRVRKLRRKYIKKGVIKLSKKPDCIMGYTDDDKIPRAQMPCGCAIAADTMWRYMKALFEKDFKGTKLFCPTPKKLCSGNDEQREWPWHSIYIIADLSQQEILEYSRIIHNRTTGTKNCPHCGAITERPKELRMCRVACNQCSGSDWCWNCANVWKSGGLGPICGNKQCMGEEINNTLKQCDWILPSWGDINKESLKCDGKEDLVPSVRACPKCCSIIQYVDECKHMWCLCCPHEFCFNCLGAWEQDGGCSHSNICDLYKSNGKYHQVFT